MLLYSCAKLFTRLRNDRLSSGRILCDKEIFFPYDRFTGYKKSNQNQSGTALPFAFALTCCKIYFLYSSLSDFHLFRWRVHLSDGVCRLRAHVQLKTLSSLLEVAPYSINNIYTWRRMKNFKWTICFNLQFKLLAFTVKIIHTSGISFSIIWVYCRLLPWQQKS